MKKDKEKKTKRKLKLRFKIILFILFILVYSFFIGTKGLFVRDFNLASKKIDDDINGLKIVHFSDIHYNKFTNYNTLLKLTKKINKLKPDVIIFTGDLISKNYKTSNKQIDKIKKQLNNLKSELGKYYVLGDDDNNTTKEILNESGFENINENVQIIYQSNKTPILLIGHKKAKEMFKENTYDNYYKMLVLHNPNSINEVKDVIFDVAICGHTTNGQINIPKIKNLFIDGKYYKPYQKVNNTKLYINNGIGNNKVNLRLFNHPSISLYRLKKIN